MSRKPRHSVNREFWPDILRRLQEGESASGLALAYGITTSAITQYLKRHGIALEEDARHSGRHGRRKQKVVRNVELASGGMVQVLCVTPSDFLALSPADRAFVTDLFERLEGYHGQRGEIGYTRKEQ